MAQYLVATVARFSCGLYLRSAKTNQGDARRDTATRGTPLLGERHCALSDFDGDALQPPDSLKKETFGRNVKILINLVAERPAATHTTRLLAHPASVAGNRPH